MLVFEERGKPENLKKTLSEQRKEPTTNLTHIWPRVWEPKPGYIGRGRLLSPRCGAVVIALGFVCGSPGPNPVLISGMDLFPVVPNSTLPRFVNSRLVASCQLGFLIMFLLSLNCFFQIIKKRGACKLA